MPAFGNAQLKLLEKLCNVIAVSGDEGEVRKIVLEEIKPCVDEVRVDALGNVLATRRGQGSQPVLIMLDAHMDEVGFMIVAEDGEGIYRFENVGGIDVRHLVGKQVLVGKERTPGVIGGKPVHLMSAEERKRTVPLEASVVRANQHVLAGADVILDARQAAAIGAAPIRGVCLVVLPTLTLTSIKQNADLLTLPEFLRQGPPQVRLVPGNDDQASYDIARERCIQDTSHLGHPCFLRAGVLRRRTVDLDRHED